MQNCRFCCPADHRIKLKECEKKYKYLDLARDLKKLWNMKVTIIPIVNGAFGTWKLADGWRPSKRQHYWERLEYWEESWKLKEDCYHSNSSERPSANAYVKNSKGVNKDIDRLYVSKKRGWELASIQDNIDTSMGRLEYYIRKCKQRLITATRKNTNNRRINRFGLACFNCITTIVYYLVPHHFMHIYMWFINIFL